MNPVLTMYLNAFEVEIQRLFEEAFYTSFKVIKIYYTRIDDPEIDSQNIQGITVHMDGTRREQLIWN